MKNKTLIFFSLLVLMLTSFHVNKSMSDLVNSLISDGVLKSPEVIDVMKRVDRADYCPNYPYEDTPQPIGYGATISAPHMHGFALVRQSSFG